MYSVGIRPPYSRWWSAIVEFLRQVVEPYLRIFRRVLPSFGPLDLSPMVATIVLIVASRIVVSLIDG
jgi:YggT family protein